MSETITHQYLKHLGLQYLWEVKKCRLVAEEVVFGNYIFDVVGTDGKRVYIIEAKQSKEDFNNDNNSKDDIIRNVEYFRKMLYETGDTSYKDKIKTEKEKSIKFYDSSIFQICTQSYIITPNGLIEEDVIPAGWGLINDVPQTVVDVGRRNIDAKYVGKFMYEIGKKNTKKYLSFLGVNFEGKGVVFPSWEL